MVMIVRLVLLCLILIILLRLRRILILCRRVLFRMCCRGHVMSLWGFCLCGVFVILLGRFYRSLFILLLLRREFDVTIDGFRPKIVAPHEASACLPSDVDGNGTGDPVGSIVKSDHSDRSGTDRSRSLLPPFLLSCDGGHDASDHMNA